MNGGSDNPDGSGNIEISRRSAIHRFGAAILWPHLAGDGDALSAAAFAKQITDPRDLIHRVYEQILREGNIDAVDTLFAPNYSDYSIHLLNTDTIATSSSDSPADREQVKRSLGQFFQAFGNVRISIEEMVVGVGAVSVRSIFTADHIGQLFGVPRTGKLVTWHSFDIFHLATTEGIVAPFIATAHWGTRNNADLLQQIGVLPANGSATQSAGSSPSPTPDVPEFTEVVVSVGSSVRIDGGALIISLRSITVSEDISELLVTATISSPSLSGTSTITFDAEPVGYSTVITGAKHYYVQVLEVSYSAATFFVQILRDIATPVVRC
jgi:predicted ester cyclase